MVLQTTFVELHRVKWNMFIGLLEIHFIFSQDYRKPLLAKSVIMKHYKKINRTEIFLAYKMTISISSASEYQLACGAVPLAFTVFSLSLA